jgi:hypothetical protein
MPNQERRFQTSYRFVDTDEPGLIQEDDGSVWVVLPDGTREEINGSGATALVDLTDVDPSGLAVNDTPTWDGSVFTMQPGGPGPTGPTGPPGTGQASVFEAQLGADAAIGATSVTLDLSAPIAFAVGTYIIIDPYTDEAEIRRITAVAGAVVTFGGGNPGLVYAHDEDDIVLSFVGGLVPWNLWGALPGTTAAAGGNVTAFNRLTEQLYDLGSFYDGGIFIPPGIWYINDELHPERDSVMEGVAPMSCTIIATDDFPFDGTDNVAMIRPQRDGVILSTSNLVSSRWVFRNFFLDGNDVPDANGILTSPQQPDHTENVRIDHCPGYGMMLADVQQHILTNFEGIGNGITLKLWAVRFLYVNGFNSEQANLYHIYSFSVPGDANVSRQNHFSNVHLETGVGDSTEAIVIESSNATSPTNYGWVFDHVWYSTPGEANTLFQWVDTGGRKAQYTIRNVQISGTPLLTTAIDDGPRSLSLNSFNDFNNIIDMFTTAVDLTASADRVNGIMAARYYSSSGGETRVGAPHGGGSFPVAAFYSNQVADPEHHARFFSSGTLVFDVNRAGALTIGSASNAIKGCVVGSTTWDPGSLADGAVESKDVTVTGAATNMPCFATVSNLTSGWLVSASCTATDVITVTIMNKTGGTVNLGNATVRACQFKF